MITRINRTKLHLKPKWDDVQIFIPIAFYRGNDAKIYPSKELRWGYWNHRVHLPVRLLISIEKVKGQGHRTLITENDFRTITAFPLHLSSWK